MCGLLFYWNVDRMLVGAQHVPIWEYSRAAKDQFDEVLFVIHQSKKGVCYYTLS
jgi:hypothetical protein